MKAHHYDIVRKDNRHSMWLEDAEDLDSAESRIRELVVYWPGEFQILDQDSHRIVATVSGEAHANTIRAKKQYRGPEGLR
jgi:hypothetical protein